MNTLLRHTFLGDVVRRIRPSAFQYTEERDPAVRQSFSTLQDVRPNSTLTDEYSPLLANDDNAASADIILVDWYNDDDPENPRNWPLSTKIATLSILCIITIAMYTGSTFWSVCVAEIVDTFQVSEVVANLGTSVFVLGFGFGPMIFSPLSEMPSIGRRHVYFWTALAFILFQLPIPLCDNVPAMIVLRFCTGLLCSPVLAVGGGTVADMFGPKTIGYPMSFWEMATWAAAAAGPTFAGYTTQRFGWRGAMWELVFLALLALLLIACLLPETLPTAILHQRAQRLNQSNKGTKFVTDYDLDESRTSLLSVIRNLFFKSIELNFREPIVFVLNLYVALTFAMFFGMLESYPYVFKGPPHFFSTGEVGLALLGVMAGGVVSMIAYMFFLIYFQSRYFDKNGNIRPEERLRPAIPGGLFVPFGLFWYGWTAHMHWIMPVLGGFWYGIGMFTLFMAMLSYLPDAYPTVAATVIAGNCLMRAVFGAAFPLFTTQFYKALGPGIATSILGAIGLVFVPWPIYLFYRGRQLRERSPHARKDI